ncbi:MAG: hypothetical protein ACI4NG_02680 [Candidatus Gallimonas sp.]
MSRKRNKKEELDVETTFVDMNVDGFRWYDPNRKKRAESKGEKIGFREYLRLVRAAFAAYLPMILTTVLVFALLVALAYVWLS